MEGVGFDIEDELMIKNGDSDGCVLEDTDGLGRSVGERRTER